MGRPASGVSSVVFSDPAMSRMDAFVVIALSSSQTNGVRRAFQYVASASATSKTTTNFRDILHYYLTHAASAGACVVPWAVAAVCQPLLSTHPSDQLCDQRRRSGAHVLVVAVGVASDRARPRASLCRQHVLPVPARRGHERFDVVARDSQRAGSC